MWSSEPGDESGRKSNSGDTQRSTARHTTGLDSGFITAESTRATLRGGSAEYTSSSGIQLL